MKTIQYLEKTIEYQIMKSKRKTITISILPTRVVMVKVPVYLSDKEVIGLLQKKIKWIYNKLSEMPEDIEGRTQYADGASVLFRGEEYKLKIIEDTRVKQPSVVLQSNELVVTMKQYVTQQVDTLVKHWYKEEARVRIEERVKQYHSFVNKEITSIKIKNQKKRWGSCSSLGNLNFNWRIVMMRDEVFDYIIVHELCHLLHMNHSKEYWKSVEQIIPYYKESENWLKQNGYKLFYQ